ncbi:hypothetical protein GF319_07805 [Candidatus Bathyarchaeota archaeon]|nr:hypothetical protein [Candidatus Bathyarchaeota archaeon]
MAGREPGARKHDSPPEHDKERGQASGPSRTHEPMPTEVGDGGQDTWTDEVPIRLFYKGVITIRKVNIKPQKKRKEYIQRLEHIIGLCEDALMDPEAVEAIQLKAADVIIRAIRMGYTIVREVDIENLERHTKEIQRSFEERDRASQG